MAQYTLENRLRAALQKSARDLNNYKAMFRNLQNQNRDLQNIVTDLNNDNASLLDTNMTLVEEKEIKDERIKFLETELSEYKVPKVYKSWSQIKSKSQRYERRKKYKKVLGKVLKDMPDTISANVSMDVGSEWMHLKFSSVDLDTQTYTYNIKYDLKQINSEHNYCKDSEFTDVSLTEKATADYETFDPVIVNGGKFSRRHLRSVVNVLDLYKIPHKGYNELRLACKGLLPPLSAIRKERIFMSEEIPYIVNP